MPDQSARRVKTSQQVETDLLEMLRQRQHDWITAPHAQRDYRRQLFITALQNFSSWLCTANRWMNSVTISVQRP